MTIRTTSVTCPPVVVGCETAPIVATTSSDQRKPSQALRSSVTTKAIVPAHSSATMAAASSTRRRASRRMSLVVIGLPRDDLVRAVELLQQHDAGQLVGQRHRPEAQPRVDVVELQAERPAHHEAPVPARLPAFLEDAGEGLG